MSRTTILFFTIFSLLFILSMAQSPTPGTSSPSPSSPGATGTSPGTPTPTTTPGGPATPTTTPGVPDTPTTTPGVPATPTTTPVVPTPDTPSVPGAPVTSSPPLPSSTGTPTCLVATSYSTFPPTQLTQLNDKTVAGAPVTIKGSVSILNSCTFLVTEFFYYFAATNSYWYGSNSTNSNDPKILVSNKPVAQTQGTTVNYTLVQDVTFNDFAVLYLYSNDEKQVYAQAVLRTPPPTSTTTESATGSGSSPTKSNDATRFSTILNIITKIIIGASVIWLSFV